MILMTESVISEAKKRAVDLLVSKEDTFDLIENSGMAVSQTKEGLIGASSFEIEGKKFFVGIKVERRM